MSLKAHKNMYMIQNIPLSVITPDQNTHNNNLNLQKDTIII